MVQREPTSGEPRREQPRAGAAARAVGGGDLRTFVGLAEGPEQAETVRNLLRASGIADEQVRFVARDDGTTADRLPREELSTAAAGAAAGTALGTFAGPFFPVGTVVGGVLGWLAGLDVPEEDARRCDAGYATGRTLVVVRARPDQAEAVRHALRQAEAVPAANETGRPDLPPAGDSATMAGPTDAIVQPGFLTQDPPAGTLVQPHPGDPNPPLEPRRDTKKHP